MTNLLAGDSRRVGFGRRLFLVSLSPLDFLSKPLQRGIALHQVRLRATAQCLMARFNE
jgi:hypothetical protein